MSTGTSTRVAADAVPLPAQGVAAGLAHPPSDAYRSSRGMLHSRKLHAVAGWVVAGLLLVSYAAMVRRYSVNFPHADDFTQLLNVPANVAHAPTLLAKAQEIFGLAIEHRIATLRLIALIQARYLGGLDFQAMMYLGSALLVVAGALIVSTVEREARPLFAAIAAALLLSPVNYEAALWATGALQHFGVAAYALAALYCIVRTGVGWQLAAAALATAALCTSAGALMLFPTGVLVLGFMRRWQSALMWALCGALVFAVYFIGYEAPPYQGSLQSYLRHPWVPARFFLMTVGALGIEGWGALVAGAGVCLVWGWVVVSGRVKALPPVWIAWLVFLALTLAAITWGRAGFGDRGALVSRYRVYSELALLVTLAAAWSGLPKRQGMRLLQGAVPLSLLWFFLCWRHDLAEVERFSISRQAQLDYYATEGHSLPNESPPADFRDFVLLGAKNFGGYDPSALTRPARELRVEPRSLAATNSLPLWIEPPIVGRRTMAINGYAAGHEDDAVIWLERDEWRYRAALEAPPHAPLALGKRTELVWGVYALSGVAPGRYRVGIGVDSRAGPTVVWSTYTVDVE